MDIEEVIEVLTELAQGRDPDTGELLPESAEETQPRSIRALFSALDVLRERAKRPANSGRPWRVEDEARIAAGHAAGKPLVELARSVGRSQRSVQARLVRLGLLDAGDVADLRFPV